MGFIETSAILVSITALLAYANLRFLRMPMSIGLMFLSLMLSLLLIALGKLNPAVESFVRHFLEGIDFNKALMEGMLSFLLFAVALHVNLNDLRRQLSVILVLATVGVLCSTFLIGAFLFGIARVFELPLSLIHCLLFGALISPTDPIAVMGIIKSVGAPKSLEIKIAGESLFNDGVGVVVFIAILGVAFGDGHHSAGMESIARLFLQEALGGLLFGLALGWIVYRMMLTVENYTVEILLTLALVTGGYALAHTFHLSGPIAMVVAGLLLGNHGRELAMSDSVREHLDTFWELIDEFLNAFLFVLIGLEVLVIQLPLNVLMMGICMIPLVLLARFISVGTPIALFRLRRRFSRGVIPVLTWGGLRGGISIALALSLPESETRDILLAITYAIVLFSIIAQGLTLRKLVFHIHESNAENRKKTQDFV